MSDATLMTWKEIRSAAAGGAMALVPIGSLEQHGPHLAVQTDTLIVTRVAGAVERELEARQVPVCRMPTLWLGCSPHHLDLFTLSLNPDVYIKVLVSLGESLIAGGFKKIFFLNGHGGNGAPSQIALNEIALRSPVLVGAGTYWELAASEIRRLRESRPGGMAHACELETSMVQYLLPEAARQVTPPACFPNLPPKATVDMTDSGPMRLGFRFSDINPEGNLGDPGLASPEKGRQLFEAIVGAVTEALQQFSQVKIANRPV